MRTIPLYGKHANGQVALVDDEDYGPLSKYRWCVKYERRPGCRPGGPYAITSIPNDEYEKDTRQPRRDVVLMHKMITGWPFTDHINHNGLDNQRHNLRPGGAATNTRNARPSLRGASSYKGVIWDRQSNKWCAKIRIDGRKIHLGYYGLEETAARAYDAAAWHFWKEEAYLNFPQVEEQAAGIVTAIILRYSERDARTTRLAQP